MSQYNRIIAGIILLWITLAVITSTVLYEKMNEAGNKAYKIDINRVNTMLSEGKKPEEIDYKQLKYVVDVDYLSLPCSTEAMSDFFEGKGLQKNNGFVLQPLFLDGGSVSGYLRFTYKMNSSDKHSIMILLNLCLLFMTAIIIAVMFYIRHSVLKPFNQIVEMPYELSKGHLKTELQENKNRFFGKFVWGLELLRQNLETSKRRELELEKDKKTMILSISHDIKTPLSTIKLYSKAIYDNLYTSEEKKSEAAHLIEEKAAQIENFVAELISASTTDILNLQVSIGEFYLSELVERISKTYCEKLKLLKTDLIIDKDENVLLKGDLDRLIEVIENIIENAIKYGDGKFVRISFSDEDYCKLITVTNSGTPILSTDFIHMFESFWRGANAQNRSGSGLGLYICKEIMKKMDGDIFAESTDTTMSFNVVVPYS